MAESSAKRGKATPWVPVLPAPEDAPVPPIAHVARGLHEARWRYYDAQGRLLGLIYRFKTSDGGKEVLPLCWARNADTGKEEWRWMAFPEPRPLYGLDRLAKRFGATVLIVEGEKCADVGDKHLPEYVTVTWPGGSKADGKADFSPLAGREVTIWPDCDAQKKDGALFPEAEQGGTAAAERIAARLLAMGCRVDIVKIPKPGEKPHGWDIADAVAEGMTGEALARFVANTRAPIAPQKPERKRAAPTPEAGAGRTDEWTERLLKKRGELQACLANVYDILCHSPEWDGVVGFNEFTQATVKLKPPPWAGATTGEWSDDDDAMATMWLTRKFEFAPSSRLVLEAIEAFARQRRFHPVRDWLAQLPEWDGEARLVNWISDYLGADRTEYSILVGKFFLIGMVARVMQPGVKFDYCLVLEGEQGLKKSTALEVLAGEWYGDTDLDLHNKDSMLALRGKWLYEFAELGSVVRAESTRQKSFLSRRVDEFRPAYGRRMVQCPRQVVFGGTTNETAEWNKDPTGGRRFWPVRCPGETDIAALRSAREQLFAEALAAYRKGARFWPTAEEQRALFKPEQDRREMQESLVDALHDWVYGRVEDFSAAMAAMDGLKLDASKLTRDMQTRIGIALSKLGCERTEKRNGTTRYWYKPPKKTASAMTGQPLQRSEEVDHVPL